MKNINVLFEETSTTKICISNDYKYVFQKDSGSFIRCGSTLKDDPLFSPIGPEILDLEVSTICHGLGTPCSWCYKGSTPKGRNMSFETFKTIFHKMPKTLTQIAFGIGDLGGNSDLFKIMEYCRTNPHTQVIPNITINGYNLTDEYAKKLVNLCGAVSVSRYTPKDVCYDAVKKLTDLGLKQCNIHALVANQTKEDCFDLMKDIQTDSRLKNLNAVVFLLLKPKGSRNKLTSISLEDYKKIIRYAMDNKIRVGTDSCAAPLFMKSLNEKELEDNLDFIESCESFGLFSSYVNVDGDYFPCSFAEGVGEWKKGISVLNCNDFLKDIWFSEKLKMWRDISLAGSSKCDCRFKKHCRPCPIYNITPCKEGRNE